MAGHFWKLHSAKLTSRLVRQRFRSQNSSKLRRFWRFKLHLVWQVQGFRRVARCVASAGRGLQKRWQAWWKRVHNDAFRVAGAMISCFVNSMFQALDAQSVERLHILVGILYIAGIISHGNQLQEFISIEGFGGVWTPVHRLKHLSNHCIHPTIQ